MDADGTPTPLPVAALVRRLAQTPPAFLGPMSLHAALSDVLSDGSKAPLSADWLTALAPAKDAHAAAWQRLCGLMTWLVADPNIGKDVTTEHLLNLFSGDLHGLSAHISAAQVIQDPDRREELCRLLLRAAGIPVDGESPATSADRLATLDTATRLRVIAESKAAEEHTRQARKALAQKRAAEAAAKATRE